MVFEKIFEHARREPRRTAIHYRGYRISYGEFAFWISDARRFLAQQNLRIGSLAVLIDVSCRLDAWVFDFALRSLGLNTIAVRSPEGLAELALRNIGCVITTIKDHEIRIPPGDSGYRFIRIPHPLYLGKTPEGVPELPEITCPAGGHVLLTSGTTGARKKVLFNATVLSNLIVRHSKAYFISHDSSANVFDFALWSGAGYKVPLCVWSMGGSIIVHQGENLGRSLLIDGITHAFCTPEKISQFVTAPAAEIRRNPDLQLFAIGAPLTAAIASAAKTALTPQLFTLISSTESGPWALTRIEHAQDLRSHSIHPSAEVEIVDRADQVLPTGQMGAIRIRTPEGIVNYLDDDAASREIFRHGCFYPGDLGEFQADGRLVLHGRASNVINLAGIKMAAEPVEQMLQDSLGADTVCLLAMRGAAGDDELHAVIQSRREIGRAEVAALIRASLPGSSPAQVHFTETIPRNEMGKIDRLVLRKQISALRAGLEV